MPLIHHYDQHDFFYIDSDECPMDPVDGQPLAPAFSTMVELIEAGANEIQVFDEVSESWSLLPDFRGQEYWLGEQVYMIQKINETMPVGATVDPPLNVLKNNKRQDTELAYDQAVNSGFLSNALGQEYWYASELKFQVQLIGAVESGLDMIFPCVDSAGDMMRRPHTHVQLKQVLRDGAIILQQLNETLEQAMNDIESASTQAELDAINVTF